VTQAEKHSEFDKAWELQLSKKYNDLAGSGKRSNWNGQSDEPQPSKATGWEVAYPDQNIPHAFTGILQRFDNPMGDCNHEIRCTITSKVPTHLDPAPNAKLSFQQPPRHHDHTDVPVREEIVQTQDCYPRSGNDTQARHTLRCRAP
jgi:hypothetical protein